MRHQATLWLGTLAVAILGYSLRKICLRKVADLPPLPASTKEAIHGRVRFALLAIFTLLELLIVLSLSKP